MRVLVFGGDGYVGWPLALKLALRHPGAKIVLADNLARRRQVAEVGGNSITPIASPVDRLSAFRRVFRQDNLEFVDLDVAEPEVDALVSELMPTHVYHLAQQASAPYSMMGVEQAAYTIRNNEIGNMRIMWAMRAHVPDAHLIKLGSFGEYAKCGLDIPEGYFRPEYKGRLAEREVPFPRESDDIYHVSKINDSNYLSIACRKWGLRVTDLMQCTIFGVCTEETIAFPELYTRFDYDAVFGTVANRFMTQIVCDHPMTIYGSGFQRTGLMGLEDSLNSMVELAEQPPARGVHRVINHVTEGSYCINELADALSNIALRRGFTPRIERGGYDPRLENSPSKMTYEIEAHYVLQNVRVTPLERVLLQTFDIISRYQDRINQQVFPPEIPW